MDLKTPLVIERDKDDLLLTVYDSERKELIIADAYLVILACTHDDYPLQMFNSKDRATNFVASCPWYPPSDHPLAYAEPSSPVCFTIVKFVDGIPTESWIERCFPEECVAEEHHGT